MVKPVAMAVRASALTDAANALTGVVSAEAVMAAVAVAAAVTVVRNAAASVAMNAVSSVLPTVPALKYVPRAVEKAVQKAALKAVAVSAVNAILRVVTCASRALKPVARNVRSAQLVSNAPMRRAQTANKAVSNASRVSQGPKAHVLSAHAAKEANALKELTEPNAHRATRQSRT